MRRAASRLLSHPVEMLDARISNLGVHALDGVVIPAWVKETLGKGLKFVPRPPSTSVDLEPIVTLFANNLRWRWMFRGSEKTDFFPWAPPTTFTPPDVSIEHQGHSIEQFIVDIQEILLPRSDGPRVHKTPAQVKQLIDWKQRMDYVIKPADKNLGIVVCTRKWYHDEVIRQLSDEKYYTRLTEIQLIEELHNIRHQRARLHARLLRVYPDTEQDSRQMRFLGEPPGEDLPYFYVIPKLHKNPVVGRPIVAQFDFLTTTASKWLTWKLLRIRQPPYVLESSQTLIQRLLALPLREGLFMMTFDVASLYTNLHFEVVLNGIQHWLAESTTWPRHEVEFLKELTYFVIANNIFRFDHQAYKQTSGIAMGTPCAPILANWALYAMEAGIPLISQLDFFGRYIDDGLCIGTLEQLQDLSVSINRMHPAIKCVCSPPSKVAVFLDLNLKLEATGLRISVYEKELNLFLYIPKSSFHAPHVFPGFIRGQLTRFARICTHKEDFIKAAKTFWHRLLARGYQPRYLCKIFDSFQYTEARKKFLEQRQRTEKTGVTALVLPRNPLFLDRARRVSRRIRTADEDVRSLNPLVAWKNAPSLQQMLVRAADC